MDSVKAFVDWVPPSMIVVVLSVLIALLCFVTVSAAKMVKFVVNETYSKIKEMLKQIQDRFNIFEVQLHDTRSQMKDGINELKLQISGLVPFHQYHEFSKEIREELSSLREKIARLEDR